MISSCISEEDKEEDKEEEEEEREEERIKRTMTRTMMRRRRGDDIEDEDDAVFFFVWSELQLPINTRFVPVVL